MNISTNGRILFSGSIVLVVLVVTAVFWNGLSNGFVWDDAAQIVNNPWIKDIGYLGKMFSSDVFGHQQSVATTNYYRPVAHVFYTATWHVFGSNAAAFHALNLLLHIAVTVSIFALVFTLLNRWPTAGGEAGRKEQRGAESDAKRLLAASLAALVFGVHPGHAEAVSWISGIMELAFTLFGLLSFGLFLEVRRKERKIVSLSLSAFLFLLALFSKETAIVFLPLFLLYDLARGDEKLLDRRVYAKYVPYLIAIAHYLAMRDHALHRFVPVDMHPDLSTYECAINVFPLFLQHLLGLVWPFDLNVFHVFHPVRSILEPRALAGLFVACCLLAGLHWSWKKDRLVFFALMLILVPLLPLFYIRAIAPILFAEQHLYLPSFGLALLLARITVWALSRDTGIRYGVPLVLVLVICVFSATTAERNPVWKDNLTLWSDAALKSPESAFVHESLAGAFLNRGRLDEAIEHYRLALRDDPTPSARTYNSLGIAYSRKGWKQEAVEAFSRALRIRPDYARAHIGLGIAFFEQGSTDRAIEEFQSAIRIDPYLVDAYHNLGVAYSAKGDLAAAEKAMREASRLDPEYYQK